MLARAFSQGRPAGKLHTWGDTVFRVLGHHEDKAYLVPTPVTYNSQGILLPSVVKVATGPTHFAAVTSESTVLSAGFNEFGELGAEDRLESGPYIIPEFTGVTDVACGFQFTVALNAKGKVWTWGRTGGLRGLTGLTTGRSVPSALGYPTTEPQRTPRLVAALKKEAVVQVAAGKNHVIALTGKA
jgi:alpha-tubulin suppressor-like RCC1 family protein